MQDDDGQSFLELAATNYVTNTLICGKASLSNGAKMSELKALRSRAPNPFLQKSLLGKKLMMMMQQLWNPK